MAQLVEAIAGIEGLWKLRLSSLEPGDLTDELLETCSGLANFAPHFHLPLQSGSDNILRKMNRQYTAPQFRSAVDRLKSSIDRPAITTDIIVGFPHESDDDFAATCEMARYAGFSKIHAFPFSAIEPTVAWGWRKETPDTETLNKRLSALRDLEAKLAGDFAAQFVGKTLEGLVEKKRPAANMRQAMTDRYMKIHFEDNTNTDNYLTGQVIRLKIQNAAEGGLSGTMAD